jgi:hypothetical protein
VNKPLPIPSKAVLDKLQIASVTGTDITLTGEEAAQVFLVVSALRIYHLTKGLPDELVGLINRP